MFVRLALVAGFVVSFLLQSTECYRVDVKGLVDKKLSSLRNERAEGSTTEVPTAVLNTMPQNQTITYDTQLVSDNVISSSLNILAKHDEIPHFMKGSQTSKRNIGNMLASVGLMRARLVLSVASSALPASLAEKVLPAAFVQQAPAAVDRPPENGLYMNFLTKGVCFLVIAATICMISRGLLEVALSTKMFGGRDGSVDHKDVRASVELTAQYALPQTMGFFLYMVNEIASILAIGHVGTKEQLAAAGLCNMMVNGFLYALTFGILSPLDALVSTAWGAGDKELCLAYVNRARFLGVLQVIWLLPVLWFAQPLLVLLGQDPEVAQHTSSFCRVLAVAYVPFLFNMSNNWLMKNIGDALIGVLGMFLGNIVHIAMCYTLVVNGGWGNLGIVVSWVASQCAFTIVQSLYVAWSSDMKDQSYVALFLLDPKMCTHLGSYVKLAIPSVLSNGSELWFWESVTILVGNMSSTALAAHVATHNVQSLLMMGPLGLMGAASTVVGMILGAGNVGLLRVMVKVFPMLAFAVWGVVFALLMVFVHEISRTYSTDAGVRSIMRTLLTMISFSGFFNAMQAMTSGCLKAMVQHRSVAYITLCSYYVISLPLAYVLGVKFAFGVYGVYASFLVGLILMYAGMTYRLATLDLQEEADKIRARLDAEQSTAN